MGFTRAPEPPRRDESGIALFMVLAALALLTVLVTDFTYVVQVNQRIAYGAIDKVRAFYLAKSALKVQLLRLKAYSNIRGSPVGGGGGGGIPGVPRRMLEMIWSFPFVFPFPSAAPGLSASDRERIEKFQKESSLSGSYHAEIESESAKYNLNLLLAPFAPSGVTGQTGPTAPTGPSDPDDEDGDEAGAGGATGPTGFDPQAARDSLAQYLGNILQNRTTNDEDFAAEYRDFRLEDLLDKIYEWADPTYQSINAKPDDPIQPKRAPFYDLAELHMIEHMDDPLYDLFSPALTVSTTPGINVNTMREHTLRALIPTITEEETEEFFKFRDSMENDNSFKAPDDFFSYVKDHLDQFRGDDDLITEFRDNLQRRNIRIVVDETEFRITVRAEVGQATQLLESFVTLGSREQRGGGSAAAGPGRGRPQGGRGSRGTTLPGAQEAGPDPGLSITFMRFL